MLQCKGIVFSSNKYLEAEKLLNLFSKYPKFKTNESKFLSKTRTISTKLFPKNTLSFEIKKREDHIRQAEVARRPKGKNFKNRLEQP